MLRRWFTLTAAEAELLDRFTVVIQARAQKEYGLVQATQVLAAIVRDYLLKHREEILEEYAALQTKHVEHLGRTSAHLRALSEAACAARAPQVPDLPRKFRRGSLCGTYANSRVV